MDSKSTSDQLVWSSSLLTADMSARRGSFHDSAHASFHLLVRPPLLSISAGVCLFLASLFLTLAPLHAVSSAPITKGNVEMTTSNGQVVLLGPGDSVPLGAKIKGTGKDGAVMAPAAGVEVTLGDNASAEFNITPGGELSVKVLSGALSYKTSPGFKGNFAIQTSSGTVDVKSGAGNLMVSGNSIRITSSSGSATFSGGGREGVEVPTGNVLGVSGTTVTITDVKSKTVSQIGMDKTVQSTQKATSSDIQLAEAVQTSAAATQATTTQATATQATATEATQPSLPPSKTDTTITSGSVNPSNISPRINSPEQ